jgi:predicted alpha-1,2-mannosidase
MNQMVFRRIFAVAVLALLVVSCENEQNKKAIGEQPVDLVYPLLDSENSRWFFFSSACRPFGMVNLSPDTEIGGAWGSGYRYNTDTIKGFSHIHAWQLSGLSVMPVSLNESNTEEIFTDFYSGFSHETEKVSPGFHYVELERYNITAELTSTRRVGFHKYNYKGQGQPALLINLNTLLGPCKNIDGFLERTGANQIVGHLTNEPTRRRPKPTRVFFQIDFDNEIKEVVKDEKTQNYLVTFEEDLKLLQMKAGISYTSVENASVNIKSELPHWNFSEVVENSKNEWNDLLSRIKIKGGTLKTQRRFYTDLWHALQGRRIISDFNGAYPDYTGESFRIGQLPLNTNGRAKFNHYNSDSFWGAQWTLNTLWGLVYPEIYEEFVHSLMQYYKDGGLIPRGPSGGNYTFVMTGASSTPFIVNAIQKGIIKDNHHEIYEALKRNHLPGGIMEKAGYEHNTNFGGGLKYYLENGYVPFPIPEGNFGFHQNGAGLTLEYAYQDWTLAQLANKLGKTEDYNYFMNRSENFKNVFDEESGWMRPKNVSGEWREPFDPYEYGEGFVESNAAQSTWFVPHNIEGLAELMGGKEIAIEKLNEQFTEAEKLGFTSGTSHELELHPEYRRIPINYGNQPSMQTAFVFNKLGRYDLSQYWSKKIIEKAYSGLGTGTGYNGDEDQGLMGSLNVLMKIGLFQMTGGTEEDPAYEITGPVFDEVVISLNPDYYPGESFVIKKQNQTDNYLIENITFNGNTINNFTIKHSEITNGGELVLKMEP